MRLALFGAGGPLSLAALPTLRDRFGIQALVVPGVTFRPSPRSLLRGYQLGRARRALTNLAGGAPVLSWSSGRADSVTARLASLRLDLICVASFPAVLPESVLSLPRLGAIGLHPSLLPRHRGPSPLFWTYFLDDREAGVSVHRLDAGVDTGDVLAQRELTLERGRPINELYRELAARGAEALAETVALLDAGTRHPSPQDRSRATSEPRPRRGAPVIDPRTWSAERAWHVLSGLSAHHNGLLARADGRLLLHGSPLGPPVAAGSGVPGTVQPLPRRWRVHCSDGYVDVARAPGSQIVREWLRRLVSPTPADQRAGTGGEGGS